MGFFFFPSVDLDFEKGFLGRDLKILGMRDNKRRKGEREAVWEQQVSKEDRQEALFALLFSLQYKGLCRVRPDSLISEPRVPFQYIACK